MDYSITKAAVIGAGVMGAGIAASIAGVGIPVVLLDIVPKELSEEEKQKGISQDSLLHKNRFAQAGKDRVCNPKTGVIFAPEMAEYISVGNLETSLEMLRECDWVVEVVAENLDIKKALFAKILPFTKPGAIITTNTSGIPIAQIEAGMPDDVKKRFLGTHFFNPPRYMRLLEIIPGPSTEPALMEYIKKFGNDILGKGIVVARDTPNFIGNRVGVFATPITDVLKDKYAFDFETVDYLTGSLVGRPKSATYRTADIVGLDVWLNVSGNLLNSPAISDGEKEHFKSSADVLELAKNGQYGNKTGMGYYKSAKDEKGRRVTLVWDAAKKEYVPLKKVKIPFVEEAKKARSLKQRLNTLVYSDEPCGKFLWDFYKAVLLYSAEKAPEISESYKDIDAAMRWGYNWEAGPFEIWDMIDPEKSAAKMKAEGASLPAWVEERLAAKKPFYEKDPSVKTYDTVYPVLQKMEHSTLLDMGDGIVGFEFRTPGSSITRLVRTELVDAINQLEANPAYKGMVLLNSANNFLTGADLKNSSALAGSSEEVEETRKFAGEFQGISMRLKYAKKPIVAAIHGSVLGGGLEFSMHCARVVAHVDSYMGLVEAGVGILPAGGGIKEMLQRGVADISAYGYNDHNPVVMKYWQYIATAAVSKNAFEAQKMGYLRTTDKIVMQIDLLPQRAKEEALLMAKEGYRQKRPALTKVPGLSGCAALQSAINDMISGNFISQHDGVVALEIAKAITGGNVPKGTLLSEAQLLELEVDGMTFLVAQEKTRERLAAFRETGRPVRN